MAAVSAFAVALMATPLAVVVFHLYRDEQFLNLQQQAALARVEVSADYATSRDPVELSKIAGGTAIALYNTDARLAAGSGPPTGDALVRSALRGRVARGVLGSRTIVALPVSSEEKVIGVVVASAPESAVIHRSMRAWAVMGALGAAAIGAAAVLSQWLSKRLSLPIDRLAAVAHDLGQGDFTARAPASGIDEIDKASDILAETAGRLGSALQRERNFSGDMAHQLMTPLATLRLTLEHATDGPSVEIRTFAESALIQLDRVESTAESLLTIRRDLQPSGRDTHVLAIEEWIRDNWHGRFAKAGRPLRVITDPQLTRIGASFGAARHVLDILLDNAFCHGAGAVQVEFRDSAGAVTMDVTDEGPGVSVDPAVLFERHETGRQGHGIGLALARSLVEADGGRLRLTRRRPSPVFTAIWPPVLRSSTTDHVGGRPLFRGDWVEDGPSASSGEDPVPSG